MPPTTITKQSNIASLLIANDDDHVAIDANVLIYCTTIYWLNSV